MEPVSNGLVFLIQTIFYFYMMAVLLRLLLQINRACFYDPLVQGVVKITQKPLVLLRRLIPGYAGFDWASIVLLILLSTLKLFLIISLLLHQWPSLIALLILVMADLLTLLCQFYFYVLVIQAILSWFVQRPSSLGDLTRLLTEPLLRRVRRWLPPLNGLDLSPLPLMLGLQLILIMVVDPLNDFGKSLVGVGIFHI